MAFRLPIRGFRTYSDCVLGRSGLEIGGPSAVFAQRGLVPLYEFVGSLDNCNFSSHTIWSDHTSGNSFVYSDRKPAGRQYVAEGMDLSEIPDNSYDFVLSSHMLEHTANPLRALQAWNRVLTTNGRLILIVPDPQWTFDHRRPVTTLAHLIEDFERSTGEDDLTHMPEILRLHDLNRDPGVESHEAFKTRCENNFVIRGMHHHVFSAPLVRSVLEHSKFSVLSIRTSFKDHIIAVAEKSS
jgi:SAM-dependent methyltransferase